MITANKYCENVFDGTHDTPSPVDKGKLLITSKHIADRELDTSSAYLISEDSYNAINKRSKIHQWDILFSMIGTVGNVYLEKRSDSDIQYAIKNMGVFSCRDKNKALWLYYYLQTPIVTKQINALMAGAVQKFVPLSFLRELNLPVFDESKLAIIKTLNSLDDKIALNRRMNAKLEAMAKRLYDYWFVQFDFPNENGRPYKSSGGKMVWNEQLKREIPAGWEVKQLGEIFDKYPTTKKFQTSEYLTYGKYPIIDQDSSSFIAGYTNDSENILHRYPAVLFGDHSTCVKFINFEFARGADGTQILYSKHDNISQYYLYLSIKSFIIPNKGYSRHFKYLKEMFIIIPNSYTANIFSTFSMDVYSKMTSLEYEIRRLTSLRDRLLPLLMNGQVEVG